MAGRVINPDAVFDPTDRGYAHARVADGTLYMSGQVGRDSDDRTAGDDIESQTRQAFENVGAVLEEVGRGFDDVAKVRSYFVDIEGDLAGYKAVWGEYFEPPYPAHTAIGVAALADPALRVEIEAAVPIGP